MLKFWVLALAAVGVLVFGLLLWLQRLPERTIELRVVQWEWIPSKIEVFQGERVRLRITSDLSRDPKFRVHAITIAGYEDQVFNIPLPHGTVTDVPFRATKAGRFVFLCVIYCGVRHDQLTGELVVMPRP